MNRDQHAILATLCLALGLHPAAIAAEGFAGRTDAPEKPDKGEYTWAEPKDWTPPTFEQLRNLEWSGGRISTARQLAADRAELSKPQLSESEALTLPNNSNEANDKILSVLSRPPNNDNEVDWDATINRVTPAAPSTLNYIFANSMYDGWMCNPLSAALFGIDYQMKPFANGDYVSAWKTIPTLDMVTMRDDLVWEDGTPLTAYDVEFTYHAIMDDRIDTPPARTGPDELRWVKAYDAKTVVFFHKQPMATNVNNIQFPILPKHVYSPGLADDPTMRRSDWNAYWNMHPLSGGPYFLRDYETGVSVLIERRDNWYVGKDGKQIRAKPYAKFVRFRIISDANMSLMSFGRGDVDEMGLSARQWAAQTDDEAFRNRGVKVRGSEWTYAYFAWNARPIPDVPFFRDKRVRLAMTYALDHKELLEKICFGLYEPGVGVFHPQSWMASPTVKAFQQDLQESERLLEQAGWKDSDGDGVRDKTIDGKRWSFEFTMMYMRGSSMESAIVLLQQNLQSVGVKMNIRPLDWATMQQASLEHRFEARCALLGTSSDPDELRE